MSHSAKNLSRGESFSVSLISGIEKVWIRGGGGGYQDFLSNIFWLTVPKNFVGEPSSVSLISGTEKVRIREGGVSRFSVEVFVSLYRSISLENTLVFQKNSFIENFHALEGGITVLSDFFVSQDRNGKLYKATLLFSGNFLVSKKIYEQEGAYHDFQLKFLCLTVPKTFERKSYCF